MRRYRDSFGSLEMIYQIFTLVVRHKERQIINICIFPTLLEPLELVFILPKTKFGKKDVLLRRYFDFNLAGSYTFVSHSFDMDLNFLVLSYLMSLLQLILIFVVLDL